MRAVERVCVCVNVCAAVRMPGLSNEACRRVKPERGGLQQRRVGDEVSEGEEGIAT